MFYQRLLYYALCFVITTDTKFILTITTNNGFMINFEILILNCVVDT